MLAVAFHFNLYQKGNPFMKIQGIGWYRLLELGVPIVRVTELSERYNSFSENMRETKNDQALVNVDTIFLLVPFGMSIGVANKLYKLGITTVRISLRKKSKKIIESQPAAYTEKMIHELYVSREQFRKWWKNDAFQEITCFYRNISNQTRLNVKYKREVRDTILFLNKHFDGSIDVVK